MRKIGDKIELKVVKILPHGAILTADDKYDYFLPIKEAAEGYVKNLRDIISEGEKVTARVVGTRRHKGKLSYQMSLAVVDDDIYKSKKFDKVMKDFMKSSEEIQKQVRQNKERKMSGKKKRPLK